MLSDVLNFLFGLCFLGYGSCRKFTGVKVISLSRNCYAVNSAAMTSKFSCWAFLVAHLAFVVSISSWATAASASERSRYRIAYVCEGSTLHLGCDAGEVIHMIRANFGRFSISLCNDNGNTNWDVQCMSPMSLRVLHKNCSRRQSCSIPANSSYFGDPCPETHKYLEAHYQCLPEVVSTHRRPTIQPTLVLTEEATPVDMDKADEATLPEAEAPPSPLPPPLSPVKREKEDTTTSAPPPKSTSVGVTSPSTATTPPSPTPSLSSAQVLETSTPPISTESLPTISPSPSPFEQPRPDSCPQAVARDINWNWTRKGQVSLKTCPGGATGFARWKCAGPEWESENPDLSLCRSIWITNLQSRLTSGGSVVQVAHELAQVTAAKSLYGGDVWAATKLLENLAIAGKGVKSEQVIEILSEAMRSGSRLMGLEQRAAWLDLPRNQQRQAATQLLVALEDNAFSLAETLRDEESIVFAEGNILMSVRLVRSDTLSSDAPMAFPSSHEKDVWSNLATGESSAIALPPEVMQENQQQDGMSRIVFFLYDQLDGILGAETLSKANTSKILVSKIISASLGKGRHVELSSPALMTFKLTQNTTNLTDPQCVFWDYTTSVWSMDGCRVLDYNGSHVACSCDHLTHFAVLMSVVTPASQVSPVHEKNLQVISYVGCILSIICLFAALVTFQFCVSNSCDRTVIHKHLCFCLLVAELVFVIGLQQTSVPAFCGVVAGILHYMFLAAFTWMFIEGFQVYVMLIEVFESEKSRLRWYYLLGYGIPALIVAISCIVDPFSYGTPDYCWLRSDNYFVFSFIGPVIVILLANVLFLSLGIAVVCRHRHSSLSLKEQSRMENLSSALRMSISLVFLLGLTWTFGIMFVTSNNVVMAYIFTVVNTLQGVFIFLLTCLQNEKVARFYARIWEQLQCCERTPDRKNGFYVTGAGTGQGSNSTNSSAVTSPNSLIVDEYMATSVISANCLATLQKNGGNGNTGPFSMNTCALHVAAIQNELGAGGPQNGQYTMHAAHPHQGTAPPTYHAQAVMTNSKHHPRCVSSAGFRSFAHPIPPTCDVNAYGAHNGFCLRCRSLSMLNNAAAAGGTYSPYNHTYTEIDPIYSEIDGRTPACGCGNPLNGGGGGQVPGNPVTHRVINSVSARISPAVSCPPPSYFQNPTPPAPAPSQRTAQSFGLSSPASHQHRHQISNTSQGSVNVSRQSSQSYQSENRPLISEAPSSASQGPMTATSSRAGGLMKMDSTDSNGGEPRLPVYHV